MHLSEGARILARENQQIQSRKSRVSFSKFGSYPAAALAVATFACGMLTQSETADAVPSFARQTGYYCSTCHTVQPELTPFGRQFKLNGYTQGGTRCGDIRKIFGNSVSDPEWSGANLSMWLLPTFNHLAKDFPGGSPAPGLPANNIVDFSDATVFYNGQVYCNLGIFSQFSYSSTGSPQGTGQIFWDNTELRYSDKTKIAGNDVVWGILGNNTPTMQDVWNTVPAWVFPWVPVDLGVFPSAGTMIEGTFSQRAYGAGAYVWVNNMFYAELSGYRAQEYNMQQATGFSPTDGLPRIDGVAPYWRLAVEKTWNENSFEMGTYGMAANLMPTVAGPGPGAGMLLNPGRTDQYTDVAVDAQYQYIGPIHAFTARAYYIWENQKLNASSDPSLGAAQGAAKPDQWLNSLNVSGSYIYDRHVSLTIDYFNIQGSSDAILYGANTVTRPNSDGYSVDLSYVPYPYGGPDLWPWLNARIGVLYTHYNKFNGSSTNYSTDPTVAPRNAADNDQIFLYSWIDF